MAESKYSEAKESKESKYDDKNRDRLMEQVQEFCMSDHFERAFESFALENSDVFRQSLEFDSNTEHPLEFHRVYREYLRRFEGMIEDFILSTGFTIEEFYDECRNIIETDEVFGSKRFFIETMLATSEYENFFMLMRAEMRQHQLKNHK